MSATRSERPVPRWVPADLFPFQSRFLEIADQELHYIDEGSGPTLLLLHGNPTWSFLYRRIVLALRARFRCIAVDYPGFGLSRATPAYDFRPASHACVLEAFVDALDLTDVTFMVQDWGGPIGLWVAGRRPERVHGLVIGNTWAWPIEGDRHFERFSKVMGGRFGGLAIHYLNAFVNVLIPMGVTRRRLPRRVMNAYRAPFSSKAARLPTHVFPREIRASASFLAEVEAGLDRLRALPALIVWGDRDPAFRARERERFERIFSNHQTRVLKGAGHYIQEDAPDEIAAAIIAWWDHVVPPAVGPT